MGKEKTLVRDSKDTAKTAFLNTVANVLSLVVGIVMIPIITRVISTEDYGIANTFIVNRNIIAIVICFGSYAYVYKSFLEFKNEKKDYLFSVFLFSFVMIVSAFFISYPFKSYIQELLSLDGFLYHWLFFSVLAYMAYYLASYYCIFQNYSKLTALITLSIGSISQVLSLFLALIMTNDKYIGRVIGLDGAYVVILAVLFAFFLVKKCKFRLKYIKFTLRYSLPLVPHVLSQDILAQFDLIMITYFVGSAAAGVYSMAYTIGLLGYTLVSQAMSSWSTWVYRRLEENNRKTIKNASKTIIILGTYIMLVLMAIASDVVYIFLTSDYYSAVYIIGPLVVGSLFRFFYLFFYDIGYFNKKTKLIAACSIFAAVANFILNSIFIPQFGFIAAAYTTMFSYFLLMFLNYCVAKNEFISEVYDVKILVLCIVMALVWMILMMLLIDLVVVRYLLVTAITAWVILTNRSFIRKIAKQRRERT